MSEPTDGPDEVVDGLDEEPEAPETPEPGPVQSAVLAELERRSLDPAEDALAALTVSLARQVDRAYHPTAAAAAGRELRGAIAEVRALAPDAPAGDAIDELAAERAKRRGA